MLTVGRDSAGNARVAGGNHIEQVADVQLVGFFGNANATEIDVVVTNTLAPSHRKTDPAKVIKSAEDRKNNKYQTSSRKIEPFALSLFGGWGESALKVVAAIAETAHQQKAVDHVWFTNYWSRRFAISGEKLLDLTTYHQVPIFKNGQMAHQGKGSSRLQKQSAAAAAQLQRYLHSGLGQC